MLQDAAAAAPPAAPPAYRTGASTPAYRTGPIPDDASDPEEEDQPLAPDASGVLPKLAPTGVTIDRYDPRVEGYRTPEDRAYEATILGGAAAAQGRQGPLDGGWLLTDPGGSPLFAFQLVDPGYGEPMEGAWRKVDAQRRSGFVLVGRDGARTILRFFEEGAASPVAVTLEPAGDGTWRGELARGDRKLPVVLRRR